jgi:hypothetical protein
MKYRRTPKTENSKMEYHVILKRSMCPKTENSKMEYLVIPKRCITHVHYF